jgi:ATP-binding cassette subfamily C protein
MIARALIGKPQVLIFDEATSALDNVSQAVVTDSLNRLHATRIVIAHRLSTIRDADKIFVMDHGRLLESGGFDELMAANGAFAALARRQLL